MKGSIGNLGYKAVNQAQSVPPISSERHEEEVDLPIQGSQVIEEGLKSEESFVITKGDIQITMGKDTQGNLKLHVRGKGSKQELEQAGLALMNRIRQQYAYHKVVTEMKQKGFVVSEEKMESGKIKLKLRRFE